MIFSCWATLYVNASYILIYFIVPTPNVSITDHNDTMVGQPFSLECIITTARGINSLVNIIWRKGNKLVQERENANASLTMFSSVLYKDYLNISQLTTDDNDETYRCEVMINADPPVMANDSYTLHVIGKWLASFNQLAVLYVLCVVPVFLVTTSPTGLVEGAVVGNHQTIQCTISTVIGVTANSVIVNWIGPSGASITNDSRVMISLLTFDNSTNNFSSSLKFVYLMEGDKGMYVCNVSILQTSASNAVEVEALTGKLCIY